MKRSRSSYEALSPRSTEYKPQGPTTEQYSASNARASVYAEFFEDALGPTETLDPLQHFLGSSVEPYALANTTNQSDNSQRNCSQAQQALKTAQQSPPQYSDGVPRGIMNCVESPGPIRASRETKGAHQHLLGAAAASPYNTRHRSCSVASHRSTATPMTNPPAASAELSEVRSTPYGPYRGLFLDSDGARNHRHLSTRFGRQPYIQPEDDPSIQQVESDRNHQVGRIYDAMVCGDRAQDNPGSIAMKRWVNCAHYKSDLVEAFAHKVFDCLLVQVKEGFRGWHHNDYVDDDRKGEKEDREADCAKRLDNIIDALEREKTICEDVVNSASQIRMFVNAPIAYAARKLQNRLGNSKRGRTKDTTDANPRSAKVRRTGGRRTRARSTTASDIPTSRDTTPQFQTSDTTAMPYYTAIPPQLPSSPSPAYLAPRQPHQRPAMSIFQVPAGYRQATATSPPLMSRPKTSSSVMPRPAMSPPAIPTSRPYSTQVTTMPPAQMSPLPSTPSLPQVFYSAPPSPEDGRYSLSASSPAAWPTVETLDNIAYTPVSPLLATNDLLSTQPGWLDEPAPVQTTSSANYFDPHPAASHVSLAEIEHASLQPADCGVGDAVADFESLWNAQPGVQPFPFDGNIDNGLSRH